MCSVRVLVRTLSALFSLSTLAAALPYTEFGSQAVGTSVSSYVAISLTSAQLQAGVTFGFHYRTDFSAGTCSTSSNGCQLAVTFTPTLPGSRSDALIVRDASGTVLSKTMVHGTGLGPMLEFNPGTSKILYTPPAGGAVSSVAVDGNGTVFFFSGAYHEQLVRLAAGATTPQTLVTGFDLGGVISVDGMGNVYYADNHGIEEFDTDTGATTLVTNTIPSLSAVDIYGNLYGLGGLTGTIVQRFDRATGVLMTIAGTTTGTAQGDGGPAIDAVLSEPGAIAVDPAGNLYIAENQGRIRKVDAATQIITTIAGNDTIGDTGDGGPASAAEVGRCASIATDPVGNLYLADENNFVIRKIDATTGVISTVAGNTRGGVIQTGQLTNLVQVNLADGIDSLAVDATRNLYSTDYWAPGVYEFSFQTPTLPFTAPGSGPDPSVAESLINTGNRALAVNSITSSGPFALQASSTAPCGSGPITLAPGNSCQTIVAYDAASSSLLGALTVTGNIGNVVNSTQQAALSLVYPQAVLELDNSPVTGPLNLGSAYVGGFANQWLTIQNSTIATLDVSNISLTGPGAADFSISLNECSVGPVSPDSNCELEVLFAPQTAGVRTATLVVNGNIPQPTTLALTGTATLPGILSSSLSPISFNLPASGAVSAPQTVTLLNTGGANVSFLIQPYLISSTVNTIANTCSNVYSLAPGASCSLTLQAAAGGAPSTGEIFALYSNVVRENIDLDIPVTTVVATSPSPLLFIPVTPCRVADTRNPTGDFGGPYVAAYGSRSFAIPSSACNIPSSAAAYSLNVTVVPQGRLGYLTAWPTGQGQPYVSTLNSSDGRVKANAAIIPAGTNGAVSFFATNDTNLILDIDGYFVPASSSGGLGFYPLVPCRVADTREPAGPLGGPSLAASQPRDIPVTQSPCNIPATAQAYSLNATVVPSTPLGYLTVWPTGETQPYVSTLNAPTGAVTANAALLSAGSNGDITIQATNLSQPTQAIFDTNGYFAAPSPSGLYFYPVAPCRIFDTRTGTPQGFTGVINADIAGACDIPINAQAVVVNATVVPSTTLRYLTLWPDGQSQPLVSTLNAYDGTVTSNMAIIPMSNGVVDAYATNNTALILDVSGYFAP